MADAKPTTAAAASSAAAAADAGLDWLACLVDQHSMQIDCLKEECMVLRDCLDAGGVLSSQAFLARLHRRRFAAVRCAHPSSMTAALADVLQTPGLDAAMARCMGRLAGRAVHAASRLTSRTMAGALRAVATALPWVPLVLGGWDGTQALRSGERFDPVSSCWEAMPPMRERRREVAAAVLHGHVYALGGDDGTQATASAERLDLSAGTWASRRCGSGGARRRRPSRAAASTPSAATTAREHPQLRGAARPRPRPLGAAAAHGGQADGVAAAAEGGQVYVFGGFNEGQFLSSAERFDPEAHCWAASPPMLERRSEAAAAVVARKILVLGGFSAMQPLRSGERYDPFTGTWEELPAMRERRVGAAAAAVAGRVYVFGGDSGSQLLASVEHLDLDAGAWEAAAPMVVPRASAAAVAVSL
eukprot:CAMPEP_0175368396 /NCGR_PEP_ID=MMETSP0095-20121207/20161_1 /TAXON_ID=311494 /ORGANISM="Alexandrium monilatum, Strain CCMP3105" /LENGTH=416 /DNA_ID=CAMNT_0016666493 /DNA_START=45 /DNA_END=1296 /DNA_ORIENTATION=+